MTFRPLKSSSPELKFKLECLKRYLLEQHPEEAVEKALEYCESFSNLRIKHKQLKADLKLSEELENKFLQLPYFLDTHYELESLKEYLEQHPEESLEKALTFYEDFSRLKAEHKQLKARLEQPKKEQRKSPQLPSFLPSKL